MKKDTPVVVCGDRKRRPKSKSCMSKSSICSQPGGGPLYWNVKKEPEPNPFYTEVFTWGSDLNG